MKAITLQEVFPGTSIQDAIDSAHPGDQIFVHAGTYYENLVVDKSIALIGEDMKTTIIDGGGKNQTIVEVTASNVAIQGFTVQNCSRVAGTSYAGIKILGSSCNVTNSVITKTKMGIFVASQGCSISRMILRQNGHGIALHSSSQTVVQANNFSTNTVGISLAFSHNNLLTENVVANSSSGGHGITVMSTSYNNTIRQNALTGNYHGMWLSDVSDNWIVGNTIAYNELLGIELADSPNNTFYHNTFFDNGLPPLAPTTKHIVIRNSVCRWDSSDPLGGNLWSDYPGTDMDGDGFGDTAYIVDPDNQDKLPLISPSAWDYTTPVPIVWNATIYSVTITSNSTISALRLNQPEMQLLLNVTHLEGTIGYSNVTVPKSLLEGAPWTISVDAQGRAPTDSSVTHNATHSFLYFTYTHASLNQVTLQGTSVIPEPLLLWLPILLAITIILLVTTFWKSRVS